MRASQRPSFLLSTALALLTPAIATFAQAPADPHTMTIRVSVTSKKGDPVTGLSQNDFTLSDNKHSESISGFREISNQPTGVLLILDAVNLPYTQVSYARQQLDNFLSSNGGRLQQPVSLGILEDKGLQIQPTFTTDGNALRQSLDELSIGLRDITRAAGFWGADERAQISINGFTRLVSQMSKDSPRRIIWVSPGWPLLSGPRVELYTSQQKAIFNQVVALSTELRRAQIVVDDVNPIGAGEDVMRANYFEAFLRAPRSPQDVDLADLSLQVVAQQSGGLVLYGSNDIPSQIGRAVAATKSVYELTFTPSPGEHENEYHELHVKVDRPGVTAHTVAGYYAKPVFPSSPQPIPQPAHP